MKSERLLLPPPLRRGDTIGIIAPAGALPAGDAFTRGISILHELGYATKFPRDLWPGCGYLADTDDNRLSEFTRLWHDPEVNAVMAARGGYGCLRLARRLAELPLRGQPKRLIGFSDITILHAGMAAEHGIVSFHGPVVTSLDRLDRQSIEMLQIMLGSSLRSWDMQPAVEVLRAGPAVTGRLAGGNLSSLVSLLGTPLAPDWRGKIVLLEDTSEPAYRIDKMLTQLSLSGLLDQAEGFLLGDFSAGLGLERSGRQQLNEQVWNRLLALVPPLVPVWGDFPSGHGPANVTVPLGLNVVMDSEAARLYRG